MPVLKVRKSVKIWCSNSKISIFASPGKFSNMENIHTMAKKYPYGYEKKFPKIFDFRDMPCHKYFEWHVPCLLIIFPQIFNLAVNAIRRKFYKSEMQNFLNFWIILFLKKSIWLSISLLQSNFLKKSSKTLELKKLQLKKENIFFSSSSKSFCAYDFCSCMQNQ